MRAESTYTKLHKMCLWGLWNYSLQAAENTIIPILISQLKKLHRVGIYTASNLSYSDPLHAVGDCKKCSETAVGNVTQWIPAISAVKRFAVCALNASQISKCLEVDVWILLKFFPIQSAMTKSFCAIDRAATPDRLPFTSFKSKSNFWS